VIALALLLSAVLVAGLASLWNAGAARTGAGGNDAREAARLPASARGPISARLGAEDRSYWVRAASDAAVASNRAQDVTASFKRSGVVLRSGALDVGLTLEAVGYAGASHALAATTPSSSANRVDYAQAGVSEWYANGPLGIEQGFTIAHAPSPGGSSARAAGSGSPADRSAASTLTLSLGLIGNARASLLRDGGSILLSEGSRSLRYGTLSATDARGRVLPAHLGLQGKQLSIKVDAARASYPLRIDPLIERAGRLTGGDESGEGEFGLSVAMAADGNTALVGGPHDADFTGSVWVFTREGATWSQQEKLAGGEPASTTPGECAEEGEATSEAGECGFGRALALSADGSTALIGAPRAGEGQGAAVVYTRGANSKWSVSEGLTAGAEETREGHFGRTVALSADGEEALVGAPADHSGHGSAWAFTRTSGGAFTQPGIRLTGEGESGEGHFGGSVALSSSGEVALIGAPGDSGFTGAVWGFARSGAAWGRQGAKLTGAGELGPDHFGGSVALSADGASALIGARADDGGAGAVWPFVHGTSGWSEQGEKLTGAEESEGGGEFGYSVALSGDGNLALVGAPRDNSSSGAIWRFARTDGVWTPGGQKFALGEGSGRGWFGASVALSADGAEPLIGDPHDNARAGSAWTVLPAPVISDLEPSKGVVSGGTAVTITGTGFANTQSVDFGATAARSFTVDSPTSITAISPPGIAGTVNVAIKTSIGVSEETAHSRFRYVARETELAPEPPPLGAPSGIDATGTAVTASATAAVGGVLGTSASAAPTCKVTLRSRSLLVGSDRRVPLRLLRTSTGVCKGKLRLNFNLSPKSRRAKLKTIGTAVFAIAAGRSEVVRIRLNATGKSLLALHRGLLSASLQIVRQVPGPSLARTSSVRLRLEKKRT
jgi:hypothetical protein